MRYAVGVEYDGTAFHGWQIQLGVNTVQEQLQNALSTVANHPVSVQCAGRTDAGVHAFGQVVHFDSDANRNSRNWLLGTNVNLPDDVNIKWILPVPDDFHARFSAISRSYRYVIYNGAIRSSILRNRAVLERRKLDLDRMKSAAMALVGTHDFSSFRAVACQAKNPVRTLSRLELSRSEDMISIELSANAFLHHMVRNIAGVLITIGCGEQPVGWAQQVLEHRDRTLGGITAPAQGLYLTHVGYPSEFGLQQFDADGGPFALI
ncbi:MAG: tRNA pseudouridine(38-40) synthase TruA [Gammaproteobacteria bacterium]|nr:tRNA pseudouridine(38-40) synthase TruA [Gammaproteobacteria bacterium]